MFWLKDNWIIQTIVLFVLSVIELSNYNVVECTHVGDGSRNNKPGSGHGNVLNCEEAHLKCSYRTGCGGALAHYLEACSHVMQGVISYCPEHCQYALVALTSTDEGQHLMTCECSDLFCEDKKRRIEVCRAQVVNTIRNETVPCRVAEGICAADSQCSTALHYYNRYCKSMFHGKKCNNRCQNSISILQRQAKAAKLNTCQCDGQETYNCRQIQTNMARLCFHNTTHRGGPPARPPTHHNSESNEIHPTMVNMLSDSSGASANNLVALTVVQLVCTLYLVQVLMSTVT